MNDHKTLASEILSEEQKKVKKWRTAFITALSALIVTVGVICCLLSAR